MRLLRKAKKQKDNIERNIYIMRNMPTNGATIARMIEHHKYYPRDWNGNVKNRTAKSPDRITSNKRRHNGNGICKRAVLNPDGSINFWMKA
tara:strand:+ start:64 stop:336 length:273 start_codon:yes stop_codon:yes gene_type:complete